MAVRTAIYAAQDALLALIKALPCTTVKPTFSEGFDTIALGFPPGGVKDRSIWIAGDTEDTEQTYRVSSLTAKEEAFGFRVHCIVSVRDADYTTARALVEQFTEELEPAINSDYTLSGTVELAEVTSVDLDEAIPSAGVRQVAAIVRVACCAWLA